MPAKADHIAALTRLYSEEFGEEMPAPAQHRSRYKPYRPTLSTTQSKIYDERARYILAHSERHTGKTWVALHKLVNHARETRNALCIVIVDIRAMAEEGGAWHKLLYMVLPEWRDCGVVWSTPRETQSKNTYIWISNRFGGWSRVLLLSMPQGSLVQDRIKGMEPSFIFIDEAQTLNSDAYFKYIIQQIGRRKDAPLQQIIYCCNPAGQSHWLYKRFFIDPVTKDEDGQPVWNPLYAVYHLPFEENKENTPEEYMENVIEASRGDDTEYRRMVLGEWVDAPLGDALFKDDFDERKHMRGNFIESEGLIPIIGYPIICGYDLGAAHSSIHFQQFIQTKERTFWMTFDEMNYVDKHTPYTVLVPQLVKRMDYWSELLGTTFLYQHISDNSAFNQFRASSGSFDAQDVERLSGGRIHMWECPKGPGSIETRVRQSKEKLQDVSWLISATCPKTREMFLNLEREKTNHMQPRKKSRWVHPFDSSTYPHLFYGSTRSNVAPTPHVGKVQPAQCYAMGSG